MRGWHGADSLWPHPLAGPQRCVDADRVIDTVIGNLKLVLQGKPPIHIVDRVTERVGFEKKVIGPDGNTKRIDVYIPETHVLIEQKSLGIALDKPQAGHDGMTPYQEKVGEQG